MSSKRVKVVILTMLVLFLGYQIPITIKENENNQVITDMIALLKQANFVEVLVVSTHYHRDVSSSAYIVELRCQAYFALDLADECSKEAEKIYHAQPSLSPSLQLGISLVNHRLQQGQVEPAKALLATLADEYAFDDTETQVLIDKFSNQAVTTEITIN